MSVAHPAKIVPTFGGYRLWARRGGYAAVGRVNEDLRLGIGSDDGSNHFVLSLTDEERGALIELLESA